MNAHRPASLGAVALLATALAVHGAAREPVPDKLVVLTFDDSVASQYSVVRPILKRYGFGATFFITEGFSFPTNKLYYMTWQQIATLHGDGFEIGNHTRDHMAVTPANLSQLTEQIEAINARCTEHGIPRPVSFAYPGNAITPGSLPILQKLGFKFARRGGAPEFPYENGRGPAYQPGRDHPLLIPSAGDARPDWTLEDFKSAVQRARNGRIAVLQFHGVPDYEHPWVSTSVMLFRQSMRYLRDEGYQVIALRDLERYVDAAAVPKDPFAIIEQRKSATTNTVLLRGEVVDDSTEEPLAARVHIQDERGRWYFPKSAASGGSAVRYQKRNWVNTNALEMHTTLSAHPFQVELRPGSYTVTVERGKEYIPVTRMVEVEENPPEVKFDLRRWVNMARLGWYSGDTHVHRSLADLPTVMLAEDLNVAFPLLYWVTQAFAPPTAGDKNTPAPATADLIRVDATHVIYPRNTEYEIFTVNGKGHTLGAVFALNHRSVLNLGAPPVQSIAERAHAEGALLDLDKHDWPWSMMLVPVMGVDLYELSNNHLWRTEFGLTNWSSQAAEFMGLPDEGRSGGELDWILYGLKNYYILLNCGFRLRPTAGTASGVHPVPLGFSRVYVHLPGGFSYQDWVRGLDAGRSFVTTGPMLLVTLNDKPPGHTFKPSGRAGVYRLEGAALSDEPLDRIEVVVNGEVARVITPLNRRTTTGALEVRINEELAVNQSGWLAVRCFDTRADGRVRFAHTGPFHFDVPGKPLRPRREEVAFLLRRVEDQIARSKEVLPPAALAEYQKAKAIYEEIARTAR